MRTTPTLLIRVALVAPLAAPAWAANPAATRELLRVLAAYATDADSLGPLQAAIADDADVNARPDGLPQATPLALAAAKGATGAVRALLDAGADPLRECAERGVRGLTPLMYAIFPGYADAGPGVFPHWQDRGGGSLAVVEALLRDQAQAQVDARNQLGETPLMIAIATGREDLVEVLLRHRPDLARRNALGLTAKDCQPIYPGFLVTFNPDGRKEMDDRRTRIRALLAGAGTDGEGGLPEAPGGPRLAAGGAVAGDGGGAGRSLVRTGAGAPAGPQRGPQAGAPVAWPERAAPGPKAAPAGAGAGREERKVTAGVEAKAGQPWAGAWEEPGYRPLAGREAGAPGTGTGADRLDRAFLAAVQANRVVEVVRNLGQGARLQATGAEGRTALMLAAWLNHEAVLNYLLKCTDRADIDRSDDLARVPHESL